MRVNGHKVIGANSDMNIRNVIWQKIAEFSDWQLLDKVIAEISLEEIMDKANQALTFLASGQIPQNSNSYTALNQKKSEMTAFRNQSIIGILLLVIFGLLVF